MDKNKLFKQKVYKATYDCMDFDITFAYNATHAAEIFESHNIDYDKVDTDLISDNNNKIYDYRNYDAEGGNNLYKVVINNKRIYIYTNNLTEVIRENNIVDDVIKIEKVYDSNFIVTEKVIV